MNTEEFLTLVDSSGLSKVDLATVLEVSRTTVYNWLNGGEIPKKNWKKIRTELTKTPEELKRLLEDSDILLAPDTSAGAGMKIVLNQDLVNRESEVFQLAGYLFKMRDSFGEDSILTSFLINLEEKGK